VTASELGVAERLESALRPFVGGDLPVRLKAWDGSSAGPDDAPLVELHSPNALRRMLWHPGELGAAQAYVTGELEVPGDLAEALTHAFTVARERGLSGRPSVSALVAAVRAAVDLGALSTPPAPPASQARIRGRLHSKLRDTRAISHHYDLSNDFYSLLLDPSMAYSSGYWTKPPSSSYGVADAQRDKLDLICRKLGLEPGRTLLDVGCGWGSLSLHAAQYFGSRVTGVTIAAEQKKFIDARIAERGLGDRVTIELCDYRDATGTYDAVGSIEMGEHVGQRNYPTYAKVLHARVRPGGRVLVQQMSRAGRWPGGGPFIESFIAPDMYMRPVGETIGFLESAGLELRDVHALREHYVWTVAAWLDTFNAHEQEIRALVGEEVLRVWRLYLVGGMLSFRDGRMGVDQMLFSRPDGGHSELPPVRSF
jgi:cyclopropane-fatty-acyl-phospholipid synthase